MADKSILTIFSLGMSAILAACSSGGGHWTQFDLGEWTWMSGDRAIGRLGVYGTQGVPSSSNLPGAREGAVSWADAQGKLWLFGGSYSRGTIFRLNDLWKYDPATDEWTWVSGSSTANQPGLYGTLGAADPSNVPGAREGSASWIDAGGRFWLFGGGGYDSAGRNAFLNDLWNYDPATNEWTWVSGSENGGQAGVYGTKGMADPGNVPGPRERAVSWIDPSGKLWLFGGYGTASSEADVYLNDLWTYDPATSCWTWLSGSESGGQAGVYGTKGAAALSNVPGARQSAMSWADPSGELWLFGGHGCVSGSSVTVALNDLWRYDPATDEWTWVSGGDTGNLPSVYGLKGLAVQANVPGSRAGGVSWVDSRGRLWLFGGLGSAISGSVLNDLWTYDPATSRWTWMSGGNTGDQMGFYGEKGASSPLNVPGGRRWAVSWVDPEGNLWLFGGDGFSAGDAGDLNDLWRYTRSDLSTH
jgi:N-acetylneuraminic acid mutarotase